MPQTSPSTATGNHFCVDAAVTLEGQTFIRVRDHKRYVRIPIDLALQVADLVVDEVERVAP